MTGDSDGTLDDSVPAGRWATTKFYGRLLRAWAAMGFRSRGLALETPEVVLEG